MIIKKKHIVSLAILAIQSSNILFLNSNSLLATNLKLHIKNCTFDEKELEDLKNKISSSDGLLEITFENTTGQSLSLNSAQKCIDNIINSLNPYFFVLRDISEVVAYQGTKNSNSGTFCLKCLGDFNVFIKTFIEKYDKISNVEEWYEFLNYTKSNLLYNFLDIDIEDYQGKSDLICHLFTDSFVDMLYTRNNFLNVENKLSCIYNIMETLTNESVQNTVCKFLEATKFYKLIIVESIKQVGNPLYNPNETSIKFNVPNDPRSFDLVKYILTAEKLKSGYSEDIYSFLLEKFIMYIFVSKDKIAKNSEDLVKKDGENIWKEDKATELFGFLLSLKNNEKNTEVAFKLVEFLKKYLEKEEIEIVKNKFLIDDNNFVKIFEKENRLENL